MDASGRTRLYREVNEHIDELLERFGAADEAEFLCECPSAKCSRLLTLRRYEFEQIRREGAFIVAPSCVFAALSFGTEVRYVVVRELREVAAGPAATGRPEAAAGPEPVARPEALARPGAAGLSVRAARPASWAGAARRRPAAPWAGSAGWGAPAA
jgi:hypothetical protein